MKVLFISRSTLYDSPGGDTVQLEKTAENLKNLGVFVTIGLCNQEFKYEEFDLIHFFNIIRPADIIYHLKKSERSVISTIFVDYTETEIYTAGFLRSNLTRLLGSDKMEYLKAVAKHILGKEKIISREYIFWGHKKSVQYILNHVNAVLPNSYSELERLQKKYKIPDDVLKFKIVNAVEITKEEIIPDDAYKGSIICVGRIERRKNQLNVIRAVKDLPQKCYIIGKPSLNDMDYYNQCKSEAGKNTFFIDHLPQKEIYRIMKAADVHVLPSWFETTGLVSLEAAYYGCNLVITEKGDQREYFKEYAFYCEPNNVDSIKSAILKALEKPFDEKFKEEIKTEYTWQKTAEQTKDAYLKVLKI